MHVDIFSPVKMDLDLLFGIIAVMPKPFAFVKNENVINFHCRASKMTFESF